MNIPDGMPTLSSGPHHPSNGRACLLEYVAFINGEEWNWHPECVDRSLANAAWQINDWFHDKYRHLLIPFIGWLSGTSSATVDPDDRQFLDSTAETTAARITGLILAIDYGADPEAVHEQAVQKFKELLRTFYTITGFDPFGGREVTVGEVKQAEAQIKELASA